MDESRRKLFMRTFYKEESFCQYLSQQCSPPCRTNRCGRIYRTARSPTLNLVVKRRGFLAMRFPFAHEIKEEWVLSGHIRNDLDPRIPIARGGRLKSDTDRTGAAWGHGEAVVRLFELGHIQRSGGGRRNDLDGVNF